MSTSLSLLLLPLVALLLSLPSLTSAQSFPSDGNRDRTRRVLSAGTSVYSLVNRTARCNRRFRTFDGTCTNDIFKLAGASGTAHFSYDVRLSSITPSGRNLPSARRISNILCAQSSDIYNDRKLSEFLVFFGQFLDHTVVASSSTGGSSFPIPVERSDPVFANFSRGFLPFTRNRRAKPVPQGRDRTVLPGVERPVNTLSSPIDLASVYGPNGERIKYLREHRGGRMKTSGRDLLPLNFGRLSNAPRPTADFFLAGDHRANEHPMLLAFHTLFVREHNAIAADLQRLYPTWNEEDLFHQSRAVNIAQFQKIVYEEFFPAITGRAMRRSKGFRKNVLPSVSVEFSTAAFRLGHTMVGNEVQRRGVNMSPLSSIPMSRAFFPRAVDVARMGGIDVFLRGALYTPAQEVDLHVHDMLRNFLFTNVNGEIGFDLIALNLQRGRDHALPSYNELRSTFTGRSARRWSDITRNRNIQSRLQSAYASVDDVEAWIGLVAEDHLPNSSVGPTLLALWTDEFGRLRDGDRLFYTNRGLFSRDMRRFGRVRALNQRGSLMRDILLRHSGVTSGEVGRSVWVSQYY